MNTHRPLRWAPRVQRVKLLRLYELAATGIEDKELIEDVAYALYVRCESIITVTEAASGRVRCPQCEAMVTRQGGKASWLTCPQCGWSIRWGDYFRSYHRKQLHGGGAIDAIYEAVRTFPAAARSGKSLLLWVDRLIHECHKGIRGEDGTQRYTRPLAVNLIEGTMQEVIQFLERLPYGPGSHPSMREHLVRWRQQVLSAIPDWRQSVQGRIEDSPAANCGISDRKGTAKK